MQLGKQQNIKTRLPKSFPNKKGFATFMAILLFQTIVSAQLEKGTWMVGGNASFTTADYEHQGTNRNNNSTLIFAPAVGYFLANRVALGLRISASNHNTIAPPGTLFPSTSVSIFQMLIGPFARYYFLKPNNRLINFFVEADFAPGYYKRSFKEYYPSTKSSISQFSVAAGPVIYFNSSVGLEFTVGYYKTNNDTQVYQSPTGFQAALGFQIHLGREKL